VQRIRLNFSCNKQISYIAHLDTMRLWERILRRADIPLAYSQGFNPHPRISMAAPRAIGITSECELMDVFLKRRVPPIACVKDIVPQLPRGIDVLELLEVVVDAPSLQAQISFAEYHVEVQTDKSAQELQSTITGLLQMKQIPWQHMRDTGPRHYDLRTLIDNIWLVERGDSICTLGMRLRCDSRGNGRPEQVSAALGFSEYPSSMHRTNLILSPRT